jgi:uncharacterized protein YdeI (YjbR/CyaY-like superfamily)
VCAVFGSLILDPDAIVQHFLAAGYHHRVKIRTFKSEAALEVWFRRNHDREPELWLKIYKKDSGIPTVTPAQALDIALCWGWIDGIRKAFDDRAVSPAIHATQGEEHMESSIAITSRA